MTGRQKNARQRDVKRIVVSSAMDLEQTCEFVLEVLNVFLREGIHDDNSDRDVARDDCLHNQLSCEGEPITRALTNVTKSG